MESGRAAITIFRVTDAFWAGLLESVTEIVTAYVPAEVGVPLIVPLEAPVMEKNPRGNPVMVHVNGPVPPVMLGVKPGFAAVGYGTLTVPPGSEVVVIARPVPTVIERACVAVSPVGLVLSVALTVKL
jgi:hypothetical protein